MTRLTTRGLFWETSCNRERDKPKYTLKLEDHEVDGIVYESAYQIFMNARTEYDAGVQIAGSFYNWQNLCECKWFKSRDKKLAAAAAHLGLDEWRRHKRLKDLHEQINNLKTKAENGDTNAAKAVIQFIEKAEKEAKVGRPKKTSSKDPVSAMVEDFQKAKKRIQGR